MFSRVTDVYYETIRRQKEDEMLKFEDLATTKTAYNQGFDMNGPFAYSANYESLILHATDFSLDRAKEKGFLVAIDSNSKGHLVKITKYSDRVFEDVKGYGTNRKSEEKKAVLEQIKKLETELTTLKQTAERLN